MVMYATTNPTGNGPVPAVLPFASRLVRKRNV